MRQICNKIAAPLFWMLLLVCLADVAHGQTLGTVTSAQVDCATVKADHGESGACYALHVQCPNLPSQEADVKVTHPPQGTAELGTIIYAVGAGGAGYYDTTFVHGDDGVVAPLIAAGYTAAQIAFLETPQGQSSQLGWLLGNQGMKASACKWATAAKWIHDNALQADAAFCGTGNSAGSSALAYALADYGFDGLFQAVELSSGPPFGRIDQGCMSPYAAVPNTCGSDGSTQYSDAAPLIDAAYGTSLACTLQKPGFVQRFIADSNVGGVANYPNTWVGQVWGGLDTGPTHSHGTLWASTITMSAGRIASVCVPSAPHGIADDPTGAAQIKSDLLAHCVMPNQAPARKQTR